MIGSFNMHTIPYFAYGSCMSPEDLSVTVDAEFAGVGHLIHHELAFTRYASFRKSGVADVIEQKNKMVEGVLLSVPNYKKLDAREGHPYVYKREMVRVFNTESKKFVNAYTYKVLDKLPYEVAPSEEYASLLLTSASKFLSKSYYVSLSRKIDFLQEQEYDNFFENDGFPVNHANEFMF